MQDLEALYLEVLYTVHHKVGKISQEVDALVEFARTAFGVSPVDHFRLMAKVQHEKVI